MQTAHVAGVALGALLIYIMITVFPGRELAAYWNRMRMNQNYAEAIKTQSPALMAKQLDNYAYYRDRLTASGYLQKRVFTLRYIPVPSEESKQFWHLATRQFPDNIHLTLRGYELGAPDELIVWDIPSNILKWKKFVGAHDVFDYKLLLSSKAISPK